MAKQLMINLKFGRQFFGFSIAGVVNTLIHLAVVTSLVQLFGIYPVLANGLAFAVANTFSFWANSRWTFRTPMSAKRYLRFLAISVIGLSVALLASALGEALHWHYFGGVFLSFLLLPLLTFVGHKYWTWKKH